MMLRDARLPLPQLRHHLVREEPQRALRLLMRDAAEEECAIALVKSHRILRTLQKRDRLVGRAGDDAQILDHLVDVEDIMADPAPNGILEIVLVRPDAVESMGRRKRIAPPRFTCDLARLALVLAEHTMIVRRDAPFVRRMTGFGPGLAIDLVVVDEQLDAAVSDGEDAVAHASRPVEARLRLRA